MIVLSWLGEARISTFTIYNLHISSPPSNFLFSNEQVIPSLLSFEWYTAFEIPPKSFALSDSADVVRLLKRHKRHERHH